MRTQAITADSRGRQAFVPVRCGLHHGPRAMAVIPAGLRTGD
ncbi:hypothetical protein [Kribbella albertanoniae]|nr:hypothetical protein [Kribbella albertanoniae]